MKKLILGVVIGVVVASPATVLADYVVHISLPNTHPIYHINDTEGAVSVFDDAGNKCYVTRGNNGYNGFSQAVAISCVKD